MSFWLPLFQGELELPTRFSPIDWHTHELFFGYLSAVIAGFLFTAVPNWTGRMPIQGYPLLLVVACWLAGRIAITFSAHIAWQIVMVADLAFLLLITVIIGTEICVGKNWRNLKVLAPVALLLAANAVFHLEAQIEGRAYLGWRIALVAAITLIMLIGGRIVPSFTRNWLAKHNPGKMPKQFSNFDMVTIAFSTITLSGWVFAPNAAAIGLGLVIATLLQIIRLYRWAGLRTLREPLLLILHVAYLFIPFGFALLAASAFYNAVPEISGVHALTAGAIGTMTLAVMVRATLGHSGHRLTAGIIENTLFSCVVIAALARILESVNFFPSTFLLKVAAMCWFFAFAGFGVCFAPRFFQKRRS